MTTCPSCGSTDIETREDEGLRCCTQCGEILPYDALRIEVTWTQDASGSSSMNGQNIQLEATSGSIPFVLGLTVVASKGAQRIRELGVLMDLPQVHTDAALRIHKLARDHNFTKGRRVDHVAVACLYAVCRRSNIPDFADKVGITVQVLGHTFLALCNSLHLDVKILDPSLYIDKFAARLEFGNKEAEVASTALRFIQRMNRDWIIIGRRPAGICGAALMMAARVHGFNRTPSDLVHVVRVGDKTLLKRINEFLKTPAAKLTAQELEAEMRARLKEKKERARQRKREKRRLRKEQEAKEKAEKGKGDESEDSEEESTSRKRKSRAKKKKTTKKKTKSKKQEQSLSFSSSSSSFSSSLSLSSSSSSGEDESEDEEGRPKKKRRLEDIQNQTTLEGIKDILDEESDDELNEADVLKEITTNFSLLQKEQGSQESKAKTTTTKRSVTRPTDTPSQSQSLETGFLPRILATPTEPLIDPNPTGEDTFSDVDSDELEGYLVPQHEVRIKERVWNALNGEFYKKKMEEKEKEKLNAAQGKPRRRNRINADSAGEAASIASQARSSLINWDALQAFDDLQADFALDNELEDFFGRDKEATSTTRTSNSTKSQQQKQIVAEEKEPLIDENDLLDFL